MKQKPSSSLSPKSESSLQEIARKAGDKILSASLDTWLSSEIILLALQAVAQPLEEELEQEKRFVDGLYGTYGPTTAEVETYTTKRLREKIAQLQKDLDWTRDNATEHCHRADTAEAAVGANCRTISALQASAQTLKEKANKSERALLRIYDWARDNEPLQTKIKRNTLLQDICEEGLGYWPGSSDFPLQARIKELEAEK